jgi:hypothetical protein
MNLRTLTPSALLAAALACGTSSTSKMSVHLVDAPGPYLEVNLHVLKVEIRNDASGWVTLGTPDRTIDLLTLTGGVVATLADGATLPAGSYGQMRLVLGSGNTVKLLDGSVHDLTVPSGQQTGVKLISHFDVQPGTVHDVYIDFEAHKSIWLHGAGASGKYILRPVVRVVDRLATGAISGMLIGDLGEGTVPLAGVQVTAQVLDAGGAASVVRTVDTLGDGSYTLDLLPVGGTYFVVSQPVAGQSFQAKASGPIAITAAAPLATYDATFLPVGGAGEISGSVTPAAGADDIDLVEARQDLDAGGTTHAFVVRTATPAMSGGMESYALGAVPPGDYSLSVTRRTIDAAGNETATTGGAVPATLVASGSATADLTIP